MPGLNRHLTLLAIGVPLLPWSFAGAKSMEEPFGTSVAVIGDVNGDGVADLGVGAPGARSGTVQGAGRVTLFSGKDGTVLFSIPGSSIDEAVGSTVAGPGDMNGDQKPDIAIGAPGFRRVGAVRLHSGKDGSLIWERIGEETLGTFGHAVAAPGDLNGDGISDLVAGAPQTDVAGLHYAGLIRGLSGKDGKTLFSVGGRREYQGLGKMVGSVGDVNGDGHSDIAAAGSLPMLGAAKPGATDLEIYSGKDGALLLAIPSGSEFANATSVVPLGDRNSDGKVDIAVGAPMGKGKKGLACGFVRILSGANGKELSRWQGTREFDNLGFMLALAGDRNGDGVPDLWVTAFGGEDVSEDTGKPRAPMGRIDLLSGKDGAVIRTIRSAKFGEMLGVSLTSPGDLNRDGVLDLLAGAPGAGVARVYSGKDGAVLLNLVPSEEK